MKKINYFLTILFVTCFFCSCKWGSYVPSSLNIGGTSTQVVLTQANFRVVRNIEAVIEVNNKNLRRADVEKSAFAELTRKYPLSGSQAYINVVCEEIRRENNNFFRFWFGGKPNLKQFIAVRATIIEFLQENGEPIKSIVSPYNTASQRNFSVPVQQEAENTDATKEQAITTIEESRPTDIESLAKSDENFYYMVLLYKTSNIDTDKLKEIKQLFDYEDIVKKAPKYSIKDLKEKSAKHDKVFEKYAFEK